jgi:hemerythrin-like domain-containing protein
LKRTEALQTLSRQHHEGLAVALKLRRSGPDTASQARHAFIAFWANDGQVHLRVEEEVLLPAFATRASADDETVVRVLVEHVELRRRGAELAAEPEPPVYTLRELGQLLEAHIRHEERVLFPRIEQALATDELVRLAAAIEAAEAGG